MISPRVFLRRGGKEGVGHGTQLASFDSTDEGRTCAFGQVGNDDVKHVVLDTSCFDASAGQALGDVDEDACLVGADLVDEDRGGVGENDMAVVRHGEFGVDHLEAVELAADLGLIGQVLLAELRGIAVGDEGDGAKVVVFVALGLALNAQHLACVSVLDDVGNGALDDGDVGGGLGGGAQLRDELAVVE